MPWKVKGSNNFLTITCWSFKVREGAPLLEGAPLGMRRRDEGLGIGVRCGDYTMSEGKAWDSCQGRWKASNNFLNNYLLSSKVREGAPLGMRRRDER